jgi:hypothetical protein
LLTEIVAERIPLLALFPALLCLVLFVFGESRDRQSVVVRWIYVSAVPLPESRV